MRKWFGCFILLLVCGALGLYIANFLLSSNPNLVLRYAEQRLGRKIFARDVRITVIPVIGLHCKDFFMADDPDFSSGTFLNAERLEVSFVLLPLLRQELRIKKITLYSPAINIVRNKAGDYNFSSVGSRNRRHESGGASNSSRTSNGPVTGLLSRISLMQVFNGQMRYLDQQDGSDLTVSQLDLKIAPSSSDNSLQIDLAMAVFAAKQNVQLKTAVGLLDSRSSLGDLPLDGELRADNIDMGRIRAALPAIRKGLPRALDLRGVYTIKALSFKGTLNNPRLRGDVDGTDASFRFD
jgi:uncharacterized protein involved in outer membrane biogenesis